MASRAQPHRWRNLCINAVLVRWADLPGNASSCNCRMAKCSLWWIPANPTGSRCYEQVWPNSTRLVVCLWQWYGIHGISRVCRCRIQVDTSFFNSGENSDNYLLINRFGHTFINGIIQLYKNMEMVGSYRIRDNFFVHNQVTANGGQGYSNILDGLLRQNAQTYDPFVVKIKSF